MNIISPGLMLYPGIFFALIGDSDGNRTHISGVTGQYFRPTKLQNRINGGVREARTLAVAKTTLTD